MSAKMNIRDSLNRKLDKARVEHALKLAMRDTMMELRKSSVKFAPKKTGNLRRSHSYDVLSDGKQVEGLLKNSANYWQYVNFGTSRMKKNPGKNFVGRAFDKVNPPAAMQKNFKKYYKN